jgi:hypothetical protein
MWKRGGRTKTAGRGHKRGIRRTTKRRNEKRYAYAWGERQSASPKFRKKAMTSILPTIILEVISNSVKQGNKRRCIVCVCVCVCVCVSFFIFW